MLDEVAWKCSLAFALGAAAHLAASRLLAGAPKTAEPGAGASAEPQESSGSESSDGEWEDEDAAGALVPHKMVLCVRTDLKMGKGAALML